VLDMPPGADWLLNFIGIKYQLLFVDTDDIRAFARTVREFSQRVAETNDEGSRLVTTLGASWEGASHSAMVRSWSQMNGANLAELHEACGLVAPALDAAAVTIDVVQIGVIAELAALAVAFVGTLTAAVATAGTATPLALAVGAAARYLLVQMEQALVAYLLFEVLERAIATFETVVERTVSGFLHPPVSDDVGVDDRSVLRMDPDVLEAAATRFDALADQMQRHGDWAQRATRVVVPRPRCGRRRPARRSPRQFRDARTRLPSHPGSSRRVARNPCARGDFRIACPAPGGRGVRRRFGLRRARGWSWRGRPSRPAGVLPRGARRRRTVHTFAASRARWAERRSLGRARPRVRTETLPRPHLSGQKQQRPNGIRYVRHSSRNPRSTRQIRSRRSPPWLHWEGPRDWPRSLPPGSLRS
jgi:uncharacterized protein YukE